MDYHTLYEYVDPNTGSTQGYAYYGSWAYAMDQGKYTFLFLQNSFGPNPSAGYDGEFYERTISDYVGVESEWHYTFMSSRSWLINQLCDAKLRAQTVILLPHSGQAMSEVLKHDPSLTTIIQESTVLAILSGHIHSWSGEKIDIAGKPVLYIGSASYETYTNLDFHSDGSRLDYQVINYGGGATNSVTKSIVAPADLHADSENCAFVPMPDPPRECETDDDCETISGARPICDNNLFQSTYTCIPKREIGARCTYDSTCASGNCMAYIGISGTCQCSECRGSGCGGCASGMECYDLSIYEPNECLHINTKFGNGKPCDNSHMCQSGCCSWTAAGANTCEADEWWRTCV